MFWLGAALFGGMVLLPLYWQQIRGESVLQTGPAEEIATTAAVLNRMRAMYDEIDAEAAPRGAASAE